MAPSAKVSLGGGGSASHGKREVVRVREFARERKEKEMMEQKLRGMREDMADQAAAFVEADKDADNMLDFDEFRAMLPERMRETHTRESLRD
eukprot:1207582-Prymnesium_polylepis.1